MYGKGNVASRKRTIVTVKTSRLTVIRSARGSVDIWCAECAAFVPMVTPEYAARLCSSTPRAIYRQIESGELHCLETAQGELLVCTRILNCR